MPPLESNVNSHTDQQPTDRLQPSELFTEAVATEQSEGEPTQWEGEDEDWLGETAERMAEGSSQPTFRDRPEFNDLEICSEKLRELRAKKQLTEDELDYYKILVAAERRMKEERFNRQMLENGKNPFTRNSALNEGQKLLLTDGQANRRRAIKSTHPFDLAARAKALDHEGLIEWADKMPPDGMSKPDYQARILRGEQVRGMIPKATPDNLMRLFDALFVGGLIDEVHYDTAADVTRDERGEEINDRYATRQLMNAARSVQLRGLSPDQLVKLLKEWSKTYKLNDIRERFLARLGFVEWDGRDRLETFLIDLLKCHDSENVRTFTRYWLFSVFMRATHPGCYCPTSLVLIGGQYSGKSQFWRLVNKAIMCREEVSTSAFDPSAKDKTRFLRSVSGRAFVGHMGEMKNFGTINTEDFKDFSTASEDSFDQKFRDHLAVLRQWIFGGDSNEYVGFWRDNNDTDEHGVSQGERRLFPLFVFQNAATGDIRWKTDAESKVDYSSFEYDFYQAMKQIERLFAEVGIEGYLAMVDENTRMVRAYSAAEKAADQGTVRTKDFDEAFGRVLQRAARSFGHARDKEGAAVITGVKIFNADIRRSYHQFMSGGKNITPQAITKKMRPLGAKICMDTNLNVTCYVFEAEVVFGGVEAAKKAVADAGADPKLWFDSFLTNVIGVGAADPRVAAEAAAVNGTEVSETKDKEPY